MSHHDPGKAPEAVDLEIEQLLEQGSLSLLQVRILCLLGTAIVLEGIDLQLVGIAAPRILAEWHMSKAEFGLAMAASLFGMAIGAPAAGRLADQLGRRPVLIAGVFVLGTLTALMSLAQTVGQIATMRLCAGVGFGAVLTVAPALAAEWMPRRLRHQIVALVVIGTPVGGMIGAAAGALIIPMWGWRSAFVIGGCLPLLLVCVALIALPESPRFLSSWPQRREQLSLLLRKYGARSAHQIAREPPVTTNSNERTAGSRAGSIFAKTYRRSTAGLALAFFANLGISYAFFSWAPVLLSSLGLPLAAAIRGLLYFNLFGALGAAGASWFTRRFGSRPILLALAGLGTLSATLLAMIVPGVAGDQVGRLPGTVILGLGAIGVATVAGQATLYALGAHMYSTERRASGLGFAGSAGRWGGLTSAATGGSVLALSGGTSAFLWLIVAMFLMAMAGVILVNRHWPAAR
jgi:AAHS family 4-hydroxybenzoate transporter-like MFS transporter